MKEWKSTKEIWQIKERQKKYEKKKGTKRIKYLRKRKKNTKEMWQSNERKKKKK